MAAMESAENADTYNVGEEFIQPLALHNTHTALAEVPMFHQHLMVCAD